jgi:nitrous oxide reductase accessory protein NosL
MRRILKRNECGNRFRVHVAISEENRKMMLCWDHSPMIGILKSFLITGAIFFVASCSLEQVSGPERITSEHPFKSSQKYTDHGRCSNCGMDRNEHANTRHEFKISKGAIYTCSLTCVAIMSMKLKEEPRDVRAADYLDPVKMLAADKAFYVVGSTAPDAMTKVSKIAFEDENAAVAFTAKYGGRVVRFNDVLAAARKEVSGWMQ